MCGIIAIANKTEAINQDLIFGLKALEYRGYDSAGVIFNDFETYKTIKDIETLSKMISQTTQKIGLAHTRWATHGKICLENAHPIKISGAAIAHNGIVENASEIKENLNYKATTTTDTEILLALLINLIKTEKDIFNAIMKLTKIAKGSYACAIIFAKNDESKNIKKDTIYWIKNGLSPLIGALFESGGAAIASDECAIKQAAKIYEIPTNSFGFINSDEIKIFSNDNILNENIKTYEIKEKIENKEEITTSLFEKEIKSQENIFTPKTINIDLSKYEFILLIGCGSAYIAAKIGASWLEEENIKAQAEIASEWNIKKTAEKENTLVILISQSGETADTLLALRKAKAKNLKTLAIINKENSTIAKEADNVVYLGIGDEKSVASSKAFTSQVHHLYILAKQKQLNLSEKIKQIINLDLANIAKEILKAKRIIIIGKNIMYAVALEGALKLKELTYINIEAHPAGELKHGYIALIDEETYTIALLPEDKIFYNKTLSSIEEIKTRNGKIILISEKNNCNADFFIKTPQAEYDECAILFAIIFQKLALELATLKNLPIDKPRNLAKSVTVE